MSSTSAITSLPTTISAEIKAGQVLAGDDYTPQQISRWYAEEKEAFYFYDNGNSKIDAHDAYLRTLTLRLAEKALRNRRGQHRTMLVLGPGTGLEIDSILNYDSAIKVIFVEASENLREGLLTRFPRSIVLPPKESGELSIESNSIDIVLALSVLHHIPNVSYLLKEFARVLRNEGYAILREPCSSMGDWRTARGLTPNERGIPRSWMLKNARRFQLEAVTRPVPILFNPLSRLIKKIKCDDFMLTSAYFWLDYSLSNLLSINDWYWRDTWLKKIGPSGYFYVLTKGE
jgi:ubiquinone/menaquinone biosynthesis C-methylase UbiE